MVVDGEPVSGSLALAYGCGRFDGLLFSSLGLFFFVRPQPSSLPALSDGPSDPPDDSSLLFLKDRPSLTHWVEALAETRLQRALTLRTFCQLFSCLFVLYSRRCFLRAVDDGPEE